MKRIISPNNYRQAKKEKKFSVKCSPGPHSAKNSIPLLVVVRDILNYAEIAKEAKKIISKKEIFVDGKARTRHNYGVGFMDILSIPKTNEYFKTIIENKKLIFQKIDKKDSNEKLCKIIGKSKIKKGLIQLHLHDSRNIVIKNNDANYKPGDSVLISLDNKSKIKKHIEFKKGTNGIIIDGKNKGKTGIIEEIKKANGFDDDIVILKNEKETFTTIKKYVFCCM